MEKLDYVRMQADRTILATGLYENTHARALVEPGRQYAVYVHHGQRGQKHADYCYAVTPGEHVLEIGLWIPEGRYQAEWIHPESGEVMEQITVDHPGSVMELRSPVYQVDIALQILRQ
jgi:hypothetical protein